MRLLPLLLLALSMPLLLPASPAPELCAVGAARVDITPNYPVRLSGYGSRRQPNQAVAQHLYAKALAIGAGKEGPAVLVTVDNCGVPGSIRDEVAKRLSSKTGLKDERFAIASSHTHCAPVLLGVLPNLFSSDLPPEHLEGITRYTKDLTNHIEQVALAALADRKPAHLSWGIGAAGFASNRRNFPAKPVDHDLPVLRVTSPEGKVRAIFTSYACHCTTLGINAFHGDWAGCAQEALEKAFPGAIALTALGCGADQNPNPRRTLELASKYGEEIATEAGRLSKSELPSVSPSLECRTQRIELAFGPPPSRQEWEVLAKSPAPATAYHAQKNLARLIRGETLPTSVPYLVQVWNFGSDLAMVFLPGEVVVDYSLRLKRSFDRSRLWVNAYSNDLTCYIPSRRVLEEGGYEGGGAMLYYDRPTKFAPDVEERIIAAVETLLPESFRAQPKETKSDLPTPLRLTLPQTLYAVEGVETTLEGRNAVLSPKPETLQFAIESALGTTQEGVWKLSATRAQAGTHSLNVLVRDSAGRALEKTYTSLRVIPSNAGEGRDIALLVVGDSLTSQTHYPTEIARLFALPGNPTLEMLGSQRSEPNGLKVAHEGYGGWSWARFNTFISTKPPEPGKPQRSPFVFAAPSPEAPAQLDVARYLKENCGGRSPDYVTFLLGINDCFGLTANPPDKLEAGITEMLKQADILLAAFHKAAPQAELGVCLTTPPNTNEAAFVANYKTKYPRWNWCQVQHRLVERQLKHLEGREMEKIFVIPTELNLDTSKGYPPNNAVHPNPEGYAQIGRSIYAWVKARLVLKDL